MELRRLGTSGLRVSALSLGAMTVGASQGRGTPYGTPTLTKGITSSDEEARRLRPEGDEQQRIEPARMAEVQEVGRVLR